MIHKLYTCYAVMTALVYDIRKLSVFFFVINKKYDLKKIK